MPTMPYRRATLLYADPCWQYNNLRTGGSHKSGSAQKYPTLPFETMAQFPVDRLMDPAGSVAAIWGTTPLGHAHEELLDAWGYTYKTKLYWHKRVLVPGEDGKPPAKLGRKGTGYWLTGEVEELAIGVRGNIKAWRSGVDNWLETTGVEQVPDGHSQKPEEILRLLELLTPDQARVELFASTHSAALVENPLSGHWSCYGLDLGHDFRDPMFWDSFKTPDPQLHI